MQTADATKEVIAVVDRFHAALKGGDGPGAMQLLAPDVVILESGGAETRAEYEKGHLPADMAFEQAVTSTRSPYKVTVVGDAAWCSSTAEFKGTFRGKPVDSLSAELMVLSRDANGWRIRAVHWSGRTRRPASP
jgi:ketosteroid isomerase-like protein